MSSWSWRRGRWVVVSMIAVAAWGFAQSDPNTPPPEEPAPATQPGDPGAGQDAGGAAGGQAVSVEMLEADVAVGAPTNADGTLNLVHYAAWLVQQSAGGERAD